MSMRGYAVAVCVGALALTGSLARAQITPPAFAYASMQCDRSAEPGRVRCTVELRLEGERTLSWADVEIVALPDFAAPLRGRIGPQDALVREATRTTWGLALVARRTGHGSVRARVRFVSCEGSQCTPASVDIETPLTVGS